MPSKFEYTAMTLAEQAAADEMRRAKAKRADKERNRRAAANKAAAKDKPAGMRVVTEEERKLKELVQYKDDRIRDLDYLFQESQEQVSRYHAKIRQAKALLDRIEEILANEYEIEPGSAEDRWLKDMRIFMASNG